MVVLSVYTVIRSAEKKKVYESAVYHGKQNHNGKIVSGVRTSRAQYAIDIGVLQ
jgi:hypothetical protein